MSATCTCPPSATTNAGHFYTCPLYSNSDAVLIPNEAKAIRVALSIGDPAQDGIPDALLEGAKRKLRSIESSATEGGEDGDS